MALIIVIFCHSHRAFLCYLAQPFVLPCASFLCYLVQPFCVTLINLSVLLCATFFNVHQWRLGRKK